MKVIVDTSVWSLALRANPRTLSPEQIHRQNLLQNLILEGRVEIIGAIRQELLSGIHEIKDFIKLRDQLRNYEDAPTTSEDYEEAARMYNKCRGDGITGSPVDLLICAVAKNRNWAVLSADKDFRQFARHIAVSLYPE